MAEGRDESNKITLNVKTTKEKHTVEVDLTALVKDVSVSFSLNLWDPNNCMLRAQKHADLGSLELTTKISLALFQFRINWSRLTHIMLRGFAIVYCSHACIAKF